MRLVKCKEKSPYLVGPPRFAGQAVGATSGRSAVQVRSDTVDGWNSTLIQASHLRDGRWTLLVALRDEDKVRVAPFDAIEFSLGDLWG